MLWDRQRGTVPSVHGLEEGRWAAIRPERGSIGGCDAPIRKVVCSDHRVGARHITGVCFFFAADVVLFVRVVVVV